MDPNDIQPKQAGEELSAAHDAEIIEALRRKVTAPNLVIDPGGWHQAAWPGRAICRFEMVAELLLPQSGVGTAEAWPLHAFDWHPGLPHFDAGRAITVADTMRMHSKMGTVTGDVGCYGLAWIPDDPLNFDPYNSLWEIITMQTPGPFFAILDSPLTGDGASPGYDSAIATVYDVFEEGHRTLCGYDPFGDNWAAANGGVRITVWNPPRENAELIWPTLPSKFFWNLDAGTAVFCMWHMRENKYYVITPVANLTVAGQDALTNNAVVRPCWTLNFDPDDFVLTLSETGEVGISLR